MYNNTVKQAELKKIVNAYIISCIDGEGYGRTFCNDKERVNFVMECFEKEYIHNNNRTGNKVTLFAGWLQGLPSSFNIDYENYRILEIAKEWETLPAKPTESQENKILGNWWNYIANKFFQLHKHLNLTPKSAPKRKNKVTQKDIEALEFEDFNEYMNYVIESKINGNPQQVKDLIKPMSKAQKKEFLTYCSDQRGADNIYTAEAAEYCHEIVLGML